MRGVIRILAVYANVLLAVLMFGDFWTGFSMVRWLEQFQPVFSGAPARRGAAAVGAVYAALAADREEGFVKGRITCEGAPVLKPKKRKAAKKR
jgi:hypothetical protein